MSCRKDPQWVNIPLVTETVTRTGNRAERLEREKRKAKEKEEDTKRRKMEAQMAKILAQRWAEEDQRKKDGKPPPEPADDSKRRRRDRSADRPRDSHGSSERDRGRRGSSRDREPRKDYESDEEADAGEQDAGGGGWHSAPARNSAVLAPISLRPNAPAEKAPEQKAPQKSKHAQKVAGIFGNIDSDDERTDARREMELATRSKQSRMATIAPGITTPGRTAGPSSSAAAAAPAVSASDVQMRLAKWKLQCKGKHVDMPPDLRRDVELMMGRGHH